MSKNLYKSYLPDSLVIQSNQLIFWKKNKKLILKVLKNKQFLKYKINKKINRKLKKYIQVTYLINIIQKEEKALTII